MYTQDTMFDRLTDTLQIQTRRICLAWRKAIAEADVYGACRLMSSPATLVSPDLPASDRHENPITTLLMNDSDPALFPHQMALISVLIAKGCETTLYDRHMLRPADYAYVSRNREAALMTIAHATARHHSTQRRDFVPDISNYFIQCESKAERKDRYVRMLINHAYIGRTLERGYFDLTIHGEGQYISPKQLEFWRNRPECTYRTAVACPPGLREAFRAAQTARMEEEDPQTIPHIFYSDTKTNEYTRSTINARYNRAILSH